MNLGETRRLLFPPCRPASASGSHWIASGRVGGQSTCSRYSRLKNRRGWLHVCLFTQTTDRPFSPRTERGTQQEVV